jgi:hypothetical protein
MLISATIKDVLSHQHPLLVVFDIIALMIAAGSAMVLVREAILFRGYRGLKTVAKSLGSSLRGSIFRDGNDLVVSGFFRGIPAVVRFSTAENMPEVHIWMKISSAMNLFVSHKSSKLTDGRVRIPTRDAWFNDRFMIRTDFPSETVALLADDGTTLELKKLCCSPGTSIALTRDSLELSELTVPQDTVAHLETHLESLAATAVRVGAISNLGAVQPKIYVPDRYIVARVALAVLAIAGMIEVYSSVRHYSDHGADTAIAAAAAAPVMIDSADEQLLPALDPWRLATVEDFDPTAAATIREHGKEASGRIPGYFNGPEQTLGTGYVFVQKNQKQNPQRRIAIIADGHAVLDAIYSKVSAVALVPKSRVAGAVNADSSGSSAVPDGDGLLVIRHENDTDSAVIFYLSDGKLATKTPVDPWSFVVR